MARPVAYGPPRYERAPHPQQQQYLEEEEVEGYWEEEYAVEGDEDYEGGKADDEDGVAGEAAVVDEDVGRVKEEEETGEVVKGSSRGGKSTAADLIKDAKTERRDSQRWARA